MIQERRRMLKLWNLTLIILTFGLTLFGTFLTRSGIIGSVHSFTQGSIGVFFLAFLALALLGAFSLLAWRTDHLRGQGELDSAISRESIFLLNNLFLLAATFTVFFGTVFPLLSEAGRGVKVSVGAPFFNLVNIPIFLALLFLMGVGPLIAWRRASAENLKRNFLKPVLAGIVAAAVLRLFGVGNVLVLTAMALVVFVAGTITLDYVRAVRARRRSGDGWSAATWGLLLRQNRRYGGFGVHLGILVIALGVARSQRGSLRTETGLATGQSVERAGAGAGVGRCWRFSPMASGPTRARFPRRAWVGPPLPSPSPPSTGHPSLSRTCAARSCSSTSGPRGASPPAMTRRRPSSARGRRTETRA